MKTQIDRIDDALIEMQGSYAKVISHPESPKDQVERARADARTCEVLRRAINKARASALEGETSDDADEYPLDINGLSLFLYNLDTSVIAEFVDQIASVVDYARDDEQGAYPALTIPHVNKSKRRAQFERSLTQLIEQWAAG